jgi:hypothetical protein
MKYVFTALTAVVALTFLAAPATADWDVGDPYKMHYPQLPDLELGLDVLATHPKILADDFLCTQTGRILDIHIWGSWKNNEFPWDPNDLSSGPSPGNVGFHLSIHNDISKENSPTGYSMPELPEVWGWTFLPGQFTWRFNPDFQVSEQFFDPNQNELIGGDNQVVQYNFRIPAAGAFPQEEGKVYWLEVTAFPGPADPGVGEPALFGWKTSDRHWNDDAVYWDQLATGDTIPQELYDPRFIDPPLSLDMAFVITPEPGTVVMLIGAGLIGLVAYARRRRRS